MIITFIAAVCDTAILFGVCFILLFYMFDVFSNPPFFFTCGILRIPVIGGKELDLHVLYVEVTKRGGYEKVCSISNHSHVKSNIYIYIYIIFL